MSLTFGPLCGFRCSEVSDPGQSEILSSWALFIQVMLLILALFCSYYLQLKKIQAVHETVISIFAGMMPPPRELVEERRVWSVGVLTDERDLRDVCWSDH